VMEAAVWPDASQCNLVCFHMPNVLLSDAGARRRGPRQPDLSRCVESRVYEPRLGLTAERWILRAVLRQTHPRRNKRNIEPYPISGDCTAYVPVSSGLRRSDVCHLRERFFSALRRSPLPVRGRRRCAVRSAGARRRVAVRRPRAPAAARWEQGVRWEQGIRSAIGVAVGTCAPHATLSP